VKLSLWYVLILFSSLNTPFNTLTNETQGELALQTNEVPVGCVFVHSNKIIGRGMNATNRTCNGTRHAEFIAIDHILSSSAYGPEILKECDLYVTIEPCIMCASLLRQIGVRKVYFGGGNERFGGTGGVLNVQRGNGRVAEEDGKMDEDNDGDYKVSGGWLREEAIVLLRKFYVQDNEKGERFSFLFFSFAYFWGVWS